jgi:hypothetical protein
MKISAVHKITRPTADQVDGFICISIEAEPAGTGLAFPNWFESSRHVRNAAENAATCYETSKELLLNSRLTLQAQLIEAVTAIADSPGEACYDSRLFPDS